MEQISKNPEVGRTIDTGGIATNYHDVGSGFPTVLIHGSGPGASAWANWRLTLPALAAQRRAIALDLVGFGFTARPANFAYTRAAWLKHLADFLDALHIERCDLIGNSFGGALALALAAAQPARVRRLALMGSMGLRFALTPGLDAVWGYTPSLANMRALLDIFAYDRTLVNDELAQLRYQASIRPGFQESFSAMFPAPRQRWIDAIATDEAAIGALMQETLIIHGRDDRVIPPDNALRLFALIPNAQLHMFGRCGHWTQIEHSARFNRLVADFLAET